MHLIPHLLLYWSALAGILLALVITPGLIQNKGGKNWQKAAFCVIIGPPVWTVLLIALAVASVTFLIQCERLRRAKKAKP